MREKIDSEKILRHIKYTKHWLDKADSDFAEKKFTSGSSILALARAELTAAWEEALQLKSRIIGKIPERTRKIHWGAASTISLLASGFIIAVIIIQFTSNPVPRTKSPQVVPSVSNVIAPRMPAVEKTIKPAALPEKVRIAVPARKRAAIRTEIKESAVPLAAPAPVLTPQPEPEEIQSTPEEVKPEPAPATILPQTLPQTEIIDLYKTAEKTLKD
jgi:hypothetical protein